MKNPGLDTEFALLLFDRYFHSDPTLRYQRYGQAFVNLVKGTFAPTLVWPQLFYEESRPVAKLLIRNWIEDIQRGEHLIAILKEKLG